MRNSELEGPQDDLDVEITDLDKADGDRPVAARLPEKPVLLLRKHRGLVTVATTGLVVLALLLILFSIAPIRQLFTPAVQQTTFYYRLDANPPWGHLSVDGRAVRMTSAEVYPLFSLTRGKHTLLWRADPFAPKQCVVMVPVGSGIDNCKHPQVPPDSGGTDSYISFPVDLNMLSTAQRAALLQTTQAAFDSQQSSEMVRTGELYAQTFGRCYGLENVSLRYFNIFGPRQEPTSPYSGVLAKFCTAFLEDTQPVIFGDGEQTRDFTYVDNAVQANLLACEAPNVSGKVFNVGVGGRFSLNQTVTLLSNISGKKLEPKYEPARDGDIRDSQADISQAREFLGYEPSVAFDEGLRRTFEWYRVTQEKARATPTGVTTPGAPAPAKP